MIPTAMISVLLQHSEGDFWFPSQASKNASSVDELFYFIFYVSLFAFIAICLATAIFAWRYRRSKVGMNPEDSPHHSTAIEIVWSVIPAALMVAMFWYGFKGYVEARSVPADAYEIQVKAKKWDWNYVYPEGVESYGGNADMNDEGEGLVVPVNTPVSIRLESADVLHSFYVPEFRVKMDVVPGRYTYAWFEAIEEGTYPLYCTEYCGQKHSRMLGKVVVKSQEDFQVWLKAQEVDLATLPPAEAGALLFKKNCASCHTVDGKLSVGPPLNAKYGTQEKLADGSSVTVDDNYIRESILDPDAKVVDGFQGVSMTSFANQFSDDEISYLISYIKSIKE